MIALLLLTANLAAIGVLSFALFTRRRHRTELILLLLSVNVLAFPATTLLTVSSLARAPRSSPHSRRPSPASSASCTFSSQS